MNANLSSSDITTISSILNDYSNDANANNVIVIIHSVNGTLNAQYDVNKLFKPTIDPKKVNFIFAYLGQTCNVSENANISVTYNSSLECSNSSGFSNPSAISRTKLNNIISSSNNLTDSITYIHDISVNGDMNIDANIASIASSKNISAQKLNYIFIYSGTNMLIEGTLKINLNLNLNVNNVVPVHDMLQQKILAECKKEDCPVCKSCETFSTTAIIIMAFLSFLLIVFIVLYFLKNPKHDQNNDD